MTALRRTRSLFRRLLPTQGDANSRGRIDGQEEFLTQVVAAVLAEDPALTSLLAKRWCGEHGTDAFEVLDEQPYAAPSGLVHQGVRVDLVLRSPEALIFVENKVGSALNRYATVAATEGDIDQVKLYHRVLEAERGARRGHLVVLCRDPQPPHDDLPRYRGHRFWWELYALVEAWLRDDAHPGGHPAWLERELLRFFDEVSLSPPRQLAPGTAFRPDHARRLLTEAARRTPGLGNPRMAQWLLFDRDGAGWSVGFQGDRLSVYEGKRGARVAPDLGAAFWEGTVEAQIDQLAGLLARVADLPPAGTARTPLDAALDQFDADVRELAGAVVAHVSERWGCAPITGRVQAGIAEITLRRADGLSLRLGPYAENRLILAAAGATAALRAAVEEVLGAPLSGRQPELQVNVPLALLDPDLIPAMIELLEQHGGTAAPT